MKDEFRNEEVETPLLKEEYREDKPVFLNFSKEQSAKLFNFEINENEKDAKQKNKKRFKDE